MGAIKSILSKVSHGNAEEMCMVVLRTGPKQGWVPLLCPFFASCILTLPWWRYQMETFSALLTICAGNSPVTGEFPTQRPVTRSVDVIFDLDLNKRLSEQSWGWWSETPSCLIWRHSNVLCPLFASCILAPQRNGSFLGLVLIMALVIKITLCNFVLSEYLQ